MKNKKGVVPVVVCLFLGAFGIVTAAAIWHIPAWTKAKAAHCEAAYQSGNYACGDVK